MYLTKTSATVVGIFCFIAMSIGSYAALAEEKPAGYEQGLMYYERNETDRAIELLRKSLSVNFTEPTSGKLKEAADLDKSGKTKEAEGILLTLLDDEATAARERYELGLIYVSRGETDKAATMFRNALTVTANKGASFVGTKKCLS